MPAEEYHRIDAANASTLKEFHRSAQHGAHALMNPREPSGPLWFGSALHSALLEPADYRARMIIDDTIGPASEVKHRKAMEANPDAIILRKGWVDQIDAMTMEALACPASAHLLNDPPEGEASERSLIREGMERSSKTWMGDPGAHMALQSLKKRDNMNFKRDRYVKEKKNEN